MTTIANNAQLEEQNASITIESRFGDLVIAENDMVKFTSGIYGFEDLNSYAITRFSGQTLTQFHVLQCLDEINLSFLLTPLMHQDELLIPAKDLKEATDHLKLNFATCDFYAITTVSEKDGGLEFSLNLKAPIVVDRLQKKGWQYILESSDYPIKSVIKLTV